VRVLALDQYSEMGGAQQCLADLIPELLAEKWEVQALLPGEGPLEDLLRQWKVPVRFIPCGPYSRGRKTLSDAANLVTDFLGMKRGISEAVESYRPDLLYVNGPRLVPAVARSSAGTPILFHSHSFLPSSYLVWLLGRELKRAKARVIASSRFTAKPWMHYTETETIYNGTPDIPFLRKSPPSGKPWRIGVIGRISPEKGQLEFVRAARQLTTAGVQAEFVIQGAPLWSSTSYLDAVRSAAEGLRVRFVEWSDSVQATLYDLDLLVVPSVSHESTTRVILEAFSAGTPVLAFPSGGIPEVVHHRRNGYLTETATVGSLVKSIGKVIENRADLVQMTFVARRDWEERYTLGRYCADLMGTMESTALRMRTGNRTAAVKTTRAAVPRTGV
jgi:glycosyltransferase involved in cell wall biosynthesis